MLCNHMRRFKNKPSGVLHSMVLSSVPRSWAMPSQFWDCVKVTHLPCIPLELCARPAPPPKHLASDSQTTAAFHHSMVSRPACTTSPPRATGCRCVSSSWQFKTSMQWFRHAIQCVNHANISLVLAQHETNALGIHFGAMGALTKGPAVACTVLVSLIPYAPCG